jgi:PIN domain nuclease of toxin-antitoxin system
MICRVDRDNLLSTSSHATIANPANELLVSAATVWEIAIKLGIGRLSLSMPYREWMDQALLGLQASILPITVDYAGSRLSFRATTVTPSTGFSSHRRSSRTYR